MANKKPRKSRYLANRVAAKGPADKSGWSEEFGFSEKYAVEIAFEIVKPGFPTDLQVLLGEIMPILNIYRKYYALGHDAAANTDEQRRKAVDGKDSWDIGGRQVRTVIGLFWALFLQGHKPVSDFIGNDGQKLERTAAALIMLSQVRAEDDIGTPEYALKRREWIEGALQLSKIRLDRLTAGIETLWPLARKAVLFKEQGKSRKREQGQQTLDRIEEALKACIKAGITDPRPRDVRVRTATDGTSETMLSPATVTRHLKRLKSVKPQLFSHPNVKHK